MTLPDLPHQTGSLEPSRAAALERQLAVERGMMRSILRGVAVALPLSVGIVIGMMALAMGDEQPWYVWTGLGAGIGAYAAGFLGMISGVTLAAHRLDDADAEARALAR